MSKLAEYYFDYKIEKIFGDSNIKTPKLYFERDCELQTYSLYAVPEEWLGQQDLLKSLKKILNDDKNKDNNVKDQVREEMKVLPYDKVKVVFNIGGVECSRLLDASSEEYKNVVREEIEFIKFYESGNGCRVMIEKQNSWDRSGIGVIDMLKDDAVIARFFLGVNFTFRKKITYRLRLEDKQNEPKVVIKFECKDRPVGIPIKVVNNERLPCLKNDMAVNAVDGGEFELDFSQSDEYIKEIPISLVNIGVNTVFSLTISDEKIAQYYMLDCQENSTLILESKRVDICPVYNCPYCHRPIDANVKSNPAYRKKGGISCQGQLDNVKFAISTQNPGEIQKKCMYCYSDIDVKNGVFETDFRRLLPDNFMEHKNFKVAFIGSTRAGKTTYISRFFGITGDDTVASMSAGMISKSLAEFGISAQYHMLPGVSNNATTGKDWAGRNEEYKERVISIVPSKYPKPTTNKAAADNNNKEKRDLTPYPFTIEVNKDSYVYFYDMAGEDAQYSTLVEKIANNEFIGVFLLINGQRDTSANDKVIEMLMNSHLKKETPIAVIVTKMDMLEPSFDSNCRCLRTDYFDGTTVYDGSSLEYEINYSSEEIKSYLKQANLLPQFVEIDSSNSNKKECYTNVKYFGVSSFNFLDSIHNEGEDIDAPGKVKFACSSKRMELPFIWMLKQFGLID